MFFSVTKIGIGQAQITRAPACYRIQKRNIYPMSNLVLVLLPLLAAFTLLPPPAQGAGSCLRYFASATKHNQVQREGVGRDRRYLR
jgi:hypothetical protein